MVRKFQGVGCINTVVDREEELKQETWEAQSTALSRNIISEVGLECAQHNATETVFSSWDSVRVQDPIHLTRRLSCSEALGIKSPCIALTTGTYSKCPVLAH